MSESVFVNVSGTAFSLLLYENIRNTCDQEGFLLGEIVTSTRRTITDNDQEVVNTEHVIRINSVLPSPRLSHFFDNAGKINTAKIDEFLQDKKSRIISWYKFKRTPSFKLSLREKIVLKQLALYIMPQNPEHFTCCLLTTQILSESGATHVFSQTFVRHFKSAYHTMPMHINNLKDPHDLYLNQQKCSTLFDSIVKSLKIGAEGNAHGYAIVDQIETSLDSHIERLVDDLKVSEDTMHSLEQRVQELRGRLTAIQDNSLMDELGLDIPTSSQAKLSVESVSKSNDQINNCKVNESPTLNKSGRMARGRKSSTGKSVDHQVESPAVEHRLLRNSTPKKL